MLLNINNSGMNYQQRNRALSECIRERCVGTGCNRDGVYAHNADSSPGPNVLYLITVLALRSLMHEFARCSRW
jgi:hypothetical protein